jgi:hypothetical protein
MIVNVISMCICLFTLNFIVFVFFINDILRGLGICLVVNFAFVFSIK